MERDPGFDCYVNTFEKPSAQEWWEYFNSEIFGNCNFTLADIGLSDEEAFKKKEPSSDKRNLQLLDLYDTLKYKVIRMKLIYGICMHYISKMPDKHAEENMKVSTDLVPKYSLDDDCMLHWFSTFSDIYMITILSLYDDFYKIINELYCYKITNLYGLKNDVNKKIKMDKPKVFAHIEDLEKSEIYKKAKRFRNDASHNRPPNSLGDEVEIMGGYKNAEIEEYCKEKDDLVERIIPNSWSYVLFSRRTIDVPVGETIQLIDDFTQFTGEKLSKLSLLLKDDSN